MENVATIVQEEEMDCIIHNLTQILSELDKQGLQIPAIHVANAIDSLVGIAD
ncbi:MAG: hypothetical protein Pars2KO_14730 [Parasphingorhabdus sp.]